MNVYDTVSNVYVKYCFSYSNIFQLLRCLARIKTVLHNKQLLYEYLLNVFTSGVIPRTRQRQKSKTFFSFGQIHPLPYHGARRSRLICAFL